MTYVYDACALIAFLKREPGSQVVDRLLGDAKSSHVIHASNLCEIYYDFIRASSLADANLALRTISQLGVRARATMDERLWKQAGQLKANGGLSIADCFAVALTRRVRGELVTADHREFDPLAQQGICKVVFIR
ncbi:MAG TPA: type II toxin-antitoxin system VapC family toxin [Thermomicrobiales bacterium]